MQFIEEIFSDEYTRELVEQAYQIGLEELKEFAKENFDFFIEVRDKYDYTEENLKIFFETAIPIMVGDILHMASEGVLEEVLEEYTE